MLWSLSSGPTDSRPLSDHLATLLDQVEPIAEAVHQLARDGFAMDWFCFLEVEDDQGGEDLDAKLVARLGALPIALNLDIYGGDASDPVMPALTPPATAPIESGLDASPGAFPI